MEAFALRFYPAKALHLEKRDHIALQKTHLLGLGSFSLCLQILPSEKEIHSCLISDGMRPVCSLPLFLLVTLLYHAG